jgi:hypothetical protein
MMPEMQTNQSEAVVDRARIANSDTGVFLITKKAARH